MKAEYIIGLEIVAFLLGWFIRDLGSLGAASPSKEPKRSRRPQNPRMPW